MRGALGGPAPSASEPVSQHPLPATLQLSQGTRSTGDRHEDGFGRPHEVRPRAVTPVEIARSQTYPTGEVPGGQFRAEDGVRQDHTKTIGRDLAPLAQGAADVLVVDGDVQQGEPAPEDSGLPSWPHPVPESVQELLGAQRCEFVHAELVDVDEVGADDTARDGEQRHIEAHHVRDHVPHPPARPGQRSVRWPHPRGGQHDPPAAPTRPGHSSTG